MRWRVQKLTTRAPVDLSSFASPCSLQESILAQVQRIVKGEVSVALKEQQLAVTSSIMQAMRSAAGTPVPAAHIDCQAQQAHILQLLQQGHLNQAFQQVYQTGSLLDLRSACPHQVPTPGLSFSSALQMDISCCLTSKPFPL